jgi:hypothetical protein
MPAYWVGFAASEDCLVSTKITGHLQDCFISEPSSHLIGLLSITQLFSWTLRVLPGQLINFLKNSRALSKYP